MAPSGWPLDDAVAQPWGPARSGRCPPFRNLTESRNGVLAPRCRRLLLLLSYQSPPVRARETTTTAMAWLRRTETLVLLLVVLLASASTSAAAAAAGEEEERGEIDRLASPRVSTAASSVRVPEGRGSGRRCFRTARGCSVGAGLGGKADCAGE